MRLVCFVHVCITRTRQEENIVSVESQVVRFSQLFKIRSFENTHNIVGITDHLRFNPLKHGIAFLQRTSSYDNVPIVQPPVLMK